MAWSHFQHEADIGLIGTGPDKAQAFEAIAMALTAAVTDPASLACTQSVAIHCSAPNDELLLVDWLNAIVYEMATRRLLFADYRVDISNDELTATARGEPVDVARHEPAVEVKGATYTALAVEQVEGQWRVQCVVDV
jgi:SHS2 domain-containing protein